ncbi:hypothetical protein ACK33N_04935 [Aeromonas veronii]
MKRFNYTGRKKILREDVEIYLKGDFTDKPVINIAINLRDYDFPQEASIFLEPQHKTRFMRIALGKVRSSVRCNNIELTEFDDAIDLDFRVKVIDASKGVLLGIVENVKAYDKDHKPDVNQESILPVSSTDLSSYGVLWRIAWSDQKAVLEIERELGIRELVVRSLVFKAFIWPEAMRQILIKVLSNNDWDPELSDTQDLSTRWLLFTRQIGAGMPDQNAEDHSDWIDDAVRILANRINVRQEAITATIEGAWK